MAAALASVNFDPAMLLLPSIMMISVRRMVFLESVANSAVESMGWPSRVTLTEPRSGVAPLAPVTENSTLTWAPFCSMWSMPPVGRSGGGQREGGDRGDAGCRDQPDEKSASHASAQDHSPSRAKSIGST